MNKRGVTGLVVATGVAAGVLGGCVGPADVERFRAQAELLRDEMRQERDAWTRAVESLEPDDPRRTDAEAALARSRAREAVADAAVRQIDLVAQHAAGDGSGGAPGEVAREVTSWLPAPMRVPAALGIALVLTIARARQLKRGIESIARGFEAARREDQEFGALFRRNANTFRATQTPAAKRAIDEATSDRAMLRLPI